MVLVNAIVHFVIISSKNTRTYSHSYTILLYLIGSSVIGICTRITLIYISIKYDTTFWCLWSFWSLWLFWSRTTVSWCDDGIGSFFYLICSVVLFQLTYKLYISANCEHLISICKRCTAICLKHIATIFCVGNPECCCTILFAPNILNLSYIATDSIGLCSSSCSRCFANSHCLSTSDNTFWVLWGLRCLWLFWSRTTVSWCDDGIGSFFYLICSVVLFQLTYKLYISANCEHLISICKRCTAICLKHIATIFCVGNPECCCTILFAPNILNLSYIATDSIGLCSSSCSRCFANSHCLSASNNTFWSWSIWSFWSLWLFWSFRSFRTTFAINGYYDLRSTHLVSRSSKGNLGCVTSPSSYRTRVSVIAR